MYIAHRHELIEDPNNLDYVMAFKDKQDEPCVLLDFSKLLSEVDAIGFNLDVKLWMRIFLQ